MLVGAFEAAEICAVRAGLGSDKEGHIRKLRLLLLRRGRAERGANQDRRAKQNLLNFHRFPPLRDEFPTRVGVEASLRQSRSRESEGQEAFARLQ